MISDENLQKVFEIRKEMWENFRNVPKEGKEVEYKDKKFIVYPNMFWPYYDSRPLVDNMKIDAEDSVLDLGTGVGTIAIFAALKGAKKVLGVDLNPDAIKAAKENAEKHHVSDKTNFLVSNMFDAIPQEKFDVITANLPFTDKSADDIVESTMHDDNFGANLDFFKEVKNFLTDNGRIYIAQANFGALEKVKQLVEDAGFNIKLVGEHEMPEDPRIFYAYELTK